MNGIYLLMGSNVGNRLIYLKKAASLIIEKGIKIIEESNIYETEPWGPKNQDWFLNIALEVATSKNPEKLLTTVLDVEEKLGRIRKEKWGERSIDIDILYYNDEIKNTESLVIPHPAIQKRRFTLVPLVEICPFEIHPTLNKTQMELLAECSDPLDCRQTDHKL
ncbi:MAG: 2-amino-4-hydroxy-6-hydroxymethyldihydropteridine diphosphokinase [Bacteroidota bacterium]